MRLFVAAGIEPQLARELGGVSEEMRQRVDARAPRAKLTWVPPDRLHFTVQFIGEVTPDRGEAIREALAMPLGVPAFSLTVAGVGTFPARGAPRVVWAGVREGRDALVGVAEEVRGRLVEVRLKADTTKTADTPRAADAPFSPHLTLARVRDAAGLRAADLLVDAASPFGTTRVDAITLFESRLSPKGPTYVPLLRTSLA